MDNKNDNNIIISQRQDIFSKRLILALDRTGKEMASYILLKQSYDS